MSVLPPLIALSLLHHKLDVVSLLRRLGSPTILCKYQVNFGRTRTLIWKPSLNGTGVSVLKLFIFLPILV